MFTLSSAQKYFLYRQYCDARKSFDGLTGLVRNRLGKDPANGDVFIFLNKRRTLVKLLHYEDGGFVIYYKRLEKGTFTPPVADMQTGSITWPDLVLMVAGIRVLKSRIEPRFQRRKEVTFP